MFAISTPRGNICSCKKTQRLVIIQFKVIAFFVGVFLWLLRDDIEKL